MKTLIFIVTVLISTISFSQTSVKKTNTFDSTKENTTQHMNKAELIDAIAKDTDSSKKHNKGYGSTRSNKQTIRATQNKPVSNQVASRISKNNNPLYKAKNDEKTSPLYNE